MFEALEHIDRTVLLAINGLNSPLFDIVFSLVSDGLIFLPLWIFIAWYIFKQKGIKYLATAIVCMGFLILFADQTANVFKNSTKRYRPTHNLEIRAKMHVVDDYRGGIYGFFSGHASNVTGVALFLFFMLTSLKNQNRFLIFLWPVIVGYSRIYLGVHYPSDILFGGVNGVVWGIVFYLIFSFLIKKLDVQEV